jgi:hypothetical protein
VSEKAELRKAVHSIVLYHHLCEETQCERCRHETNLIMKAISGTVAGEADEKAELPLVDDLAQVLASMVVGWEDILGVDLADHPSVVRVMKRYRKERKI